MWRKKRNPTILKQDICGIQISKQKEAQFGLYLFISRNRFNPYKLSAIDYVQLCQYNQILHDRH